MNQIQNFNKCNVCNSTNIDRGEISGSGNFGYSPAHTDWLAENTPVSANLCLDCGNLQLYFKTDYLNIIKQRLAKQK
ncbi:MAG: hypothetical protein WC801_03190 [Patescibacteria group bacterium]|jgi:hypothetical protein